MSREQQNGERDQGTSCREWANAQFQSDITGRGGRETRSDDGEQRSSLARIIEARVIPRLLLAHGPAAFKPPLVETAVHPQLRDRVGEFADLVINPDASVSAAYFLDLLADGTTAEQLFADLLAPTARRLGELWEEDINTMFDVTQGLSHLQQLVRTFSPDFQAEAPQSVSNRRALIMPFPGETHTFGAALVEQYFRREGWHVWGGPPASLQDVLALVGHMWFDMVGFSVARVPEPEKLRFDLRLIREAARNKNMALMIGGRAFVIDPGLASLVGADATAVDGPQAVLQVTGLIGGKAAVMV